MDREVKEYRSCLVAKTNLRLDELLVGELGISRSKAQKYIQNGVLVDGKLVTKNGYKVSIGQQILFNEEVEETEVIPNFDPLPYRTVYEDEDILIIDKPRGLVVHPAPGHYHDTIVNYLVAKYQDLDRELKDGSLRPGIVHRIDKDTSGLLVVAKNEEAKSFLVDEIAAHRVNREYIALVKGLPASKKFRVEAPIGRNPYNRQKMSVDLLNGKPATTHFELISTYRHFSLLRCQLESGRTHQIRVHLSYFNLPILGDKLYGDKHVLGFESGQLLHAYKLTLTHPSTKKTLTFYSPIDDYFKEALLKIYTQKNR